ncbi:MAG: hypothetical protein DRP41_06510 [Thermodesulfobacteriota bacterium]|nr:MAG: hypothetical protein DRP41_06510 [Thermodesulfobacteriota bacterium]
MLKVWQTLKYILGHFIDGFKEQSVDMLEKELYEMENAFALVLCGSLIGLPAPPPLLGLSLLPYLERELNIMFAKSANLDDKLAPWTDMIDL